jgi:hypothetical protein
VRKLINCKLIRVGLHAPIILLLLAQNLIAQEKEHFIVHFDISSIEKIFNDPQWVIDNYEQFSKDDMAYQLADAWHRASNYPKEPDSWKEQMEDLAAKMKAERLKDPSYMLAMDLYEKKDLFQKKAVAHVEKFLPNLDKIHEETTIYITAYTVPYSFMIQGNSVLDTTSPYWKGDLNFTLNETAHELFHVGYTLNRKYRKEEALESDLKNSLLGQLHNEGIATYVGYTIQDLFPCQEPDQTMMDNPQAVKKKIAMVNNIFRSVDILSLEEMEKISWDDGVMARAYYVAGGHMARTIDQELGREALIETIVQGPLFFVNTYNSLVTPDRQIVRFASPDLT